MSQPDFAGIFDTNALIQVVPNLKVAQTFLLEKFFPNIVTSDTEFVSIDVDIGKRRLAPFVSPLVEGKLVEQRRIQTNTFKPPYIKDKRAPDLLRPVKRQIGERIGGALSAVERMQANIAFEMEDQLDMVQRRLEWMAANALVSGTVTVTGDGFPTTLIDFGRDAGLTITLDANHQWDTGVDAAPAQDLENWANLILKKSGAVSTDVVFSPTAFASFVKNDEIKAAIVYDTSRFFMTDKNQVQMAPAPAHGAMYKGKWGGFDLWVYNDWYVDPVTNVETRMVADGTVIMSGKQLQGTQAFASIIDPMHSYQAMPFAPKIWYQEDPAQTFLMMQSAPIVIPSRINASLCATVATAVET